MQSNPEPIVLPPAQATPQEQRLLRPPEAARTLAISERQLWQLTHDGAIRAVRIGRAVRYDLSDIREFVAARRGVRHGRDEAIASSNA